MELGYPLAGDPQAVRAGSDAAGVAIACLATRISMPKKSRQRMAAAGELRAALELAGRLGCRRVRILDTLVHPGLSANGAAVEMASWLLPLADRAAGQGVTIVVENALYFRRARDLWMLLESINHPNVAACWDLDCGVAAGESPLVSVPVLNSRIQYARVRGGEDATVQTFVTRLKGIGYAGYLALVDEGTTAMGRLARIRAWAEPPPAGKEAKPKPQVVAK